MLGQERPPATFTPRALNDTSPDQTLTITPPGNWTVGQFLSELAGLKTDAAASRVLVVSEEMGTKLVPVTVLNVVMQKGLLSAAPTFPPVGPGAAVPGWKLTRNTAYIATSNFQYNGWAYPSTEPGACS